MTAIAIIGAGPAGLMAALEGARQGHECVVLEAAEQVGGMSASFEIAGQRVDLGSHRLHPAAGPEVLDLLGGLLGDDLQVRPRNGRIRLHDRWVAFPLRLGDLVAHLPWRFGLGVVRDLATSPLRGRGPEPSFSDEVTARLGPTVARDFYLPYARKLYGADPDTLDVELANRRISAPSAAAIARRAFRRQGSTGRSFLYPRTGYGAISERLAEAAAAAGARIETGAAVERIERGASVRVHHRRGVEAVDLVWSTAPLPVLAGALDAVSSEVTATLARLRTRAMVLVYLVVERDQYTSYDAHYLPGLDTIVARLSEPKNYRDGPDPTSTTVLCAEVPCWVGDDIWNATPDELGSRVAADLARLGLPAVSPSEVRLRHLSSVYPVYETETRADRAVVAAWAGGLDRVLSFGRQGLGVPDNLHHCLAMGRSAVAAVGADGGLDREAWRRSLSDFEAHVVED